MLNTGSFELFTYSLQYNISEAFFKGQYRHDQQDMELECLFYMKLGDCLTENNSLYYKVILPLLPHKWASNF